MLDHPHYKDNFNSQLTHLHHQCCLLNRFRLMHIQLTLRKKKNPMSFKSLFFYINQNLICCFHIYALKKANSSIPILPMSSLFDLQVVVVITMRKIKIIILITLGSFKLLKHRKLEFHLTIIAIVITINNSKSSHSSIRSHPLLLLLILINNREHILISSIFVLK